MPVNDQEPAETKRSAPPSPSRRRRRRFINRRNTIIVAIVAAVGIVLFIVPGLSVMVSYFSIPGIAVIENLGVRAALRRLAPAQ